MRFSFCFFILSLLSSYIFAQSQTGINQFSKKIITDQLEDPWTIIYAPDNHLWITEAKGYRVLRIDPQTSHRDTLADLNNLRSFSRYDTLSDEIDGGKPWPQAGLMGMALHPAFLNGKPYVYLAYLYDFEGKNRPGKGESILDGGFHFLTRIVRYQYDSAKLKLIDPVTICDSIPGSNDHNGGRLLIADINNKAYLFYSVGDMGAGQFKNGGRRNNAQNSDSYEGKLLRFETEPLVSTNTADAWIPQDNPFKGERKKAIWSLGHRNAQGLTKLQIQGKDQIYLAEHGPFSDDEINIISRGSNYGHPLVIGYADGNYNGLAAGVTEVDSLPGKWNTTYPLIIDEVANAGKIKNYVNPLKSFYPTSNKELFSVETGMLTGAVKDKEWESLAPSGVTSYNSDAIPGWKFSLLVTSLKQGKITRLKLNSGGTRVVAEEELFKGSGRYRDISVSADGTKIYIITDRSAVTSGPTEGKSANQELRGAIIEYTYLKQNGAGAAN
ncbi:PQQ-dependent sugar dehydrogenase [Flavitalea sp.]|nr:PQQ-dependent sugar dehydrogenase [Flavitalea sp.]